MKDPILIKGENHQDQRGNLTFNNTFDTSSVKRLYTISNSESNPVRGWQGHQIESRWFMCMQGSFEITLIAVDDWEHPSIALKKQVFLISATALDVLFTPPGYITKLNMLAPHSKLVVMSDYAMGEVQDEYRFDLDYFN
ncbi:MAG: dTDP-4-dehydrorhamnose 3,5-epimerase-like enzyme [Patiriisocius sp.]|jgi:dTDP-4-dehydrorhamnose 3,5-epimerase-like enzyme